MTIEHEPTTQYGPWRRIELTAPLSELVRIPGGHGLLGVKLPLVIYNDNRHEFGTRIDFAFGEPGYEQVIGRVRVIEGKHAMALFATPQSSAGPFCYRQEINTKPVQVFSR